MSDACLGDIQEIVEKESLIGLLSLSVAEMIDAFEVAMRNPHYRRNLRTELLKVLLQRRGHISLPQKSRDSKIVRRLANREAIEVE